MSIQTLKCVSFHDEHESLLSFEDTIQECTGLCHLGFRTSFNQAIERLANSSHDSIYHANIRLVLHAVKTLLTLERSDVEEGIQVAKETIDLCDKYRKPQTIVTTLRNLLTTTDYNDYSDDEVHALLIKAESMMIMGNLMTMLNDQSVFTLVRAAFKMQSAYKLINTCVDILDTRSKWSSGLSRAHFEAGVQQDKGNCILGLSHMPDKILRILTMVGVDCDREHALIMQDKCSRQESSYHSLKAKLTICLYECLAVPILGATKPDVNKVMTIVDNELNVCNESTWGLLFKAQALKLVGDMDGAIIYFKRCIDTQRELKQVHNLCYWDLSFCHGLKMEWEEAVMYADLLVDQCNWSRATFTYMKAAFLYMKMIEEDRPDLKDEISKLLRLVPSLKQRFSGKTIPMEKYICANAEKYFTQSLSLALPAFDLFYIWNIYSYATDNPKLVEPIINRIDETLIKLSEDDVENQCLLNLIMGICLKVMGQYDHAEKCFHKIFESKSKLGKAKHILVMASLEMGLTNLNAKLYSEAEVWLKKAEKYRKYLFEMMIHFRAHSALQRVKYLQNNTKI